MNPVIKPRIFNDENALENAEAVREKNDAIRGAMLRAEKMSSALRLIVMGALALLLAKDLGPAVSPSGLFDINGPAAALAFARAALYSLWARLSSAKLYYFSLAAALWYIAGRPSLFLPLFVENFASAYKKGLKLMQREKYDAAIEKFNSALKNFIPPSEKIKIRLALAECHFILADYDECLRNGFEILELDGGNEQAKSYIGRAFLQQNDRGELAVKYYIHLFNREVYDHKMLQILYSHFLATGDLSDIAVSVYKKAYEIWPENSAVREMVFKSCVIVNDRSSYALKLYQDINADEPGRKDVKLALVSAYYESKNFRRAAETARALFAQKEFSRKLLEIFVESVKNSGDLSGLYEEFAEMAAANPGNRMLADYFDAMKPQFLAGKIVSGAAACEAPAGAGGRGQKMNICGNCAHMNPAGLSHCEKCRSALNTGH